ncbi:MAG TPA: hypothetical protein VF707_11390, partial [Ardenticatenaceae bacterium]
FLTACMTEQEPTLPGGVPPEEGTLAAALVRLARESHPSPTFAATLEAQVRAATPRPTIRRRVSPARWLGWAALLLLMLAGLLAVPQVRAGLLEVLRIGAVRILLVEPTPTVSSSGQAPVTATPVPRTAALGLVGETTLDEAQREAGFPVRLPTYPADLGPPDQVFLQDLDGAVVVLVWLDPTDPREVRLSLHQLANTTFAEKGEPESIERTTVHGRPAIWSEGPYVLQFRRADGTYMGLQRLVTGNVLIWQEEDGGVTYRLETDLPLDEARRIAESLR